MTVWCREKFRLKTRDVGTFLTAIQTATLLYLDLEHIHVPVLGREEDNHFSFRYLELKPS